MHRFSGRASSLALAVGFALAGQAHAGVVISQVYGGGGNSGAPYRSDFIELHNTGTTPVDLAGWSVQYQSAAGTGTWQRTNLAGTIEPGAYYLVKQADGANTAATPLPAADASGSIAMSATAGKVALVRSTVSLSGGCPTANVIDRVGFGSADCFEGAGAAPATTNAKAILRADAGCLDTDQNRTDFALGDPAPRNRAGSTRLCVGALPALSIDDAGINEGDGATQLRFTVRLSEPAGAEGVRFRYSTVDGSATVADDDYTAVTGGEGVIAPGESTAIITIAVTGDSRVEDDETLQLRLHDVYGAVIGSATATGTLFDDDRPLTAIARIQGSSERSPLAGQFVATRGVVTGRKRNGFFIQSLDIDADTSADTSEGLFVFTNTPPPADVVPGRVVRVRGTVTEYVPSADPGQAPLTQLAGTVRVSTLEEGLRPLPAPVMLHTGLPAPHGALDQLEHLEGMRVGIADFTVTAPTDGNTDEPTATGRSNGVLHGVVTGLPRPFREPGIQAPDAPPGGGTVPPIPRWDFNPELLAVDTDGLGGAPLDLAAGTRIADVSGPLDYGFRRYTILLDPSDTRAVINGPAPHAAQAPMADAFTVAAYNLERFFDEHPDGAGEPRLTADALERRMSKASLAIRDMLHAPDILGVIEVEHLGVLQRLAERVNRDAVAAGQPDPNYVGYLLEGNDPGGIDVGFLIRTANAGDKPRVEVRSVEQVGKDYLWTTPAGRTEKLNDRPPLALDATVHYADGRAFPVSVVLVHQRSLLGSDDDTASGERNRAKRQRQAEFLAGYLNGRQKYDPATRLVVLGDFNAFEFNDGLADTMNTVAGTPTPDEQTVVPGDGVDLVDPDLVNLGGLEPAHERYSFVFGGNAQTLDHVLVNEELIVNTRGIALGHARINADFPETNRNDANSPSRLSDHDPVVAYFVPARIADLTLTAFAPFSTVQAGTTLAFEATLTNAGPEQADRPAVTFELDAGLPGLETLAPAGWTCAAPDVTASRTRVNCAADLLANGATAGFMLGAHAGPELIGRTVRLTASSKGESIDPSAANNSAGAQLAVVSTPDLGVSIAGPDRPVRSGAEALEYRVTLENYAANAAYAPVLTLSGEAPAAGTSVTAPAGWSCPVAAAGTGFMVTCRAASFAAASTRTFDLRLQVPRLKHSQMLTMRARISASGTDTRADNNEAAHTAHVVPGPR